ncbi:YdeI/OmpD-associated family protein [Flagellimonas halotolerans]|uniref:YdeI/OmpD-associated family protein n=1 Tax=Flagellimonas halotolerans TaxID=3112164 RepID=A0ABU6IPP1_9FLAO|nr:MULTISPECIES: YdeI/OmpD-associated family protein [unclassified Allomuricauda]MEC3965083.1 YdeI/OmpD-associated family protein [Muricauda sp. SYSU M86414]MEC4265072.1 YdeI/OmpD-associated family protein [Muricauda sp. SYSU M84420]
MEKSEKLESYYEKEHPFREGIGFLREIALKTEAQEDFKWSIPVYTWNNKNVFGICKFKGHFGIWFFNGVFLTDSKKVLENAQEGKTKGMRHWKFHSLNEVDQKMVLAYMVEALEHQKKGLEVKAERTSKVVIPELLQSEFSNNATLKVAFEKFTPYKQKEFCEYIAEAKQEKTKLRRLAKILPMIKEGVGLNDGYR